MIFQAVVSNKAHPEYGQATIPFPIPDSEYDQSIELLEGLAIGSPTDQDCRVDELNSGYKMPKKDAISIADMTQKAYDRILQEDYAKKTYQQYWYCGVIPIRRYCEQREIKEYSFEGISDCVSWFREQYEQGAVYPAKFQLVRRIAVIMECIARGELYQWQALTPWYATDLPAPYCNLLEDYAEQKRKNGCKETTMVVKKGAVSNVRTEKESVPPTDRR